MNEAERKIRAALRGLAGEPPAAPCPSAETLACYAEGLLPPGERAPVEDHLAACAECLDAVLLQRQPLPAELLEERTEEPLHAGLGRLAQGILARLDLCDLAVRWVRGALEVVEGATAVPWQYAMAQTAVRSGATAGRQRVHFTKAVGPLTLEVELTHDDEGYGVVLSGAGLAGAGADRRVNLYSGDRELDSLPVGDTPLTFEGLPPAYYCWVVEEHGESLGSLALDLRDEDDRG
jgi:hypothetical protein